MSRVALIAGPKGSGKSRVGLAVVERLRQAGIRVAGFVQEARGGEGDEKGYDLVRLAGPGRAALATGGGHAPRTGDESFCSFVFHAGAFALARRWLEDDAPGADVLVLDEISKLEVAGRGHHEALAWALGRPQVVLACVRADQLFAVIERFGRAGDFVASLELPATATELDAFVATLLATCK